MRVHVTHEYRSRRTAATSGREDQNQHGGTRKPLDVSVSRELTARAAGAQTAKNPARCPSNCPACLAEPGDFEQDASRPRMCSWSLNVAAIHIENPTLAAPKGKKEVLVLLTTHDAGFRDR